MCASTTVTSSRPQYASPSLYVGDLAPEVTEATLYEFFNSVGPVASIKVCRDSSSRRSLRYAYVNYHSVADAERALESLNYTPIKGTCCRIMWSQRDPTVRKSNQGNLFVKNLDKGVDNRALHDTFSLFGNILSCKVATDDQGKSKGYGFVHFESDEAATKAIECVNGMKIFSKEVYVAHHQKRNERPATKQEHFTNLYVKDFPKLWTEDTIRSIFAPMGEITSIWLSTDVKHRPFACVNFLNPPDAKKAIAELHHKFVDKDGLCEDQEAAANKFNDEDEATTTENKATDQDEDNIVPPANDKDIMQLFVDRAQDRSERNQNLKHRFEKNQQFRNKYEGVNLYIKNLAEKVDDNELRAMFEKFGTITSAKVMLDESGHSKSFGFVCFTTTDEATKAIAEMHLQVIDGKPLYVGLAEQKDRRHARLQTHFGSKQPPVAPPPYHQAPAAVPPQQMPPPFYGAGPAIWPNAAGNAAAFPPQATTTAGGAPPPPNVMWKTTAGAPAAPPSQYLAQPPTAATGAGMTYPFRAVAAATAARPSPADDPVPMRKRFWGERLFPLVYQHQPSLAGKITGMMLEMDESKLMELVRSEAELKSKINEALRVLQAAHP